VIRLEKILQEAASGTSLVKGIFHLFLLIMGTKPMDKLYEFLTGPALWAAFIIFFAGLVARITYLYAVRKLPGIASHEGMSRGRSYRAVFDWLVPFGSRAGMRSQPVFSTVSFVFHICLLGVPIFLLAHNTLWDEAFAFSLPSLSESFAETLTVIFLMSALFLLTAKIVLPAVRSQSTAKDYFLLLLSSAPFLTGFLAHRQIGPYRETLILHIFSGEILLMIIPFSIGSVAVFFRGK
jgi:nitrate reductase gamma subunit